MDGRATGYSPAGNNATGFAILQREDCFEGLLNGVALVGAEPIAGYLNQWTHLALVSDGGVTTLYVNGVNKGSVNDGANIPLGGMTLGAGQAGDDQGSVFSSFFGGGMDEVRIFTFEPGQFQMSDLLYPAVPEPATMGLLGLGSIAFFLRKK